MNNKVVLSRNPPQKVQKQKVYQKRFRKKNMFYPTNPSKSLELHLKKLEEIRKTSSFSWASQLLPFSEAHGVAVRLGSQDHPGGAQGREEVHLGVPGWHMLFVYVCFKMLMFRFLATKAYFGWFVFKK